MAPPGMEEMTSQLQNMFSNMSKGKTATRKITVADAMKQLKDEEASKLINEICGGSCSNIVSISKNKLNKDKNDDVTTSSAEGKESSENESKT